MDKYKAARLYGNKITPDWEELYYQLRVENIKLRKQLEETITLVSIQTGPILTTLEQRSLNKPDPL